MNEAALPIGWEGGREGGGCRHGTWNCDEVLVWSVKAEGGVERGAGAGCGGEGGCAAQQRTPPPPPSSWGRRARGRQRYRVLSGEWALGAPQNKIKRCNTGVSGAKAKAKAKKVGVSSPTCLHLTSGDHHRSTTRTVGVGPSCHVDVFKLTLGCPYFVSDRPPAPSLPPRLHGHVMSVRGVPSPEMLCNVNVT